MADTETDTQIVLIPSGSNTPERIDTSIHAFNQPLANLLEHVSLPTENILSPVEERRKVITSLASVIEILPVSKREKSVYLSKFTVAITVGLFDGALNFLWDETIKALRALITRFDLSYFFSVAETVNNKYKNLNSEDDLEAIGDHDLLEICRRIGLLDDINHKRLEHVNYLRNHASAAHPNENSISGTEMLGLLDNCLRYAILADPDHSVIQVKQLFNNIRSVEIPDADFPMIGAELSKLPPERIDDFVMSIFGLYVDSRTTSRVKTNVAGIVPIFWPNVAEETKFNIGAKFGTYRKNGDVARKEAVQTFLEIVDGQKYKDEESLTGELIEKLQELKTAHFGFNNFYNEYAHAKSIAASIPATGVPNSVRKFFVKVVVVCWVGNGRGRKEGVDERAERYYKRFIAEFERSEIKDFLILFNDPEFVGSFGYTTPDKRLRKLAEYFIKKTKDEHINTLLDLLLSAPVGKMDKLASLGRYRKTIQLVK